MSDKDGKSTLGLGGSGRSGQVKQSFSHGRTKSVVVETKRKRVVVPKPGATTMSVADNLTGPWSAPRIIYTAKHGPAGEGPYSGQAYPWLSTDNGKTQYTGYCISGALTGQGLPMVRTRFTSTGLRCRRTKDSSSLPPVASLGCRSGSRSWKSDQVWVPKPRLR